MATGQDASGRGKSQPRETPRTDTLYDPTTDSFSNAPPWVNKLLDNPQFRNALQKGLEKYLGET